MELKLEDVIIVGAGISGLAARKILSRFKVQALVIEKSRGLGGRCATRRFENGFADHGAQFTKLKSTAWNLLTEDQRAALHPIFFDPKSVHPRFIHPEGMSKLAHFLELSGSIRLQTRVTKIGVDETSFSFAVNRVETEQGEVFFAKELLLTAPLPQSIELLETCSDQVVELPEWVHLKKIEYDPCIALIVECEDGLKFTNRDGIWKNPSSLLSGIYDQKRKGLATSVNSVVVHASPDFSRVLWSKDEATIREKILEQLQQVLSAHGYTIQIIQSSVHRWRFSEPKICYPAPYASLSRKGAGLWFAGDAFLHSSVEGALESGVEAAQAIHAKLISKR